MGGGNTLLLTRPVFQTPPSGGGYYIEAMNPVVGGATLIIELVNPDPVGGGALTKAGAGVQINW